MAPGAKKGLGHALRVGARTTTFGRPAASGTATAVSRITSGTRRPVGKVSGRGSTLAGLSLRSPTTVCGPYSYRRPRQAAFPTTETSSRILA